MMAEDPAFFNTYLDQLGDVSGISIQSFDKLMLALDKRHQFFHENGCRLSDHGLETAYAEDFSLDEIRHIFLKIRKGGTLSPAEILQFKFAAVKFLDPFRELQIESKIGDRMSEHGKNQENDRRSQQKSQEYQGATASPRFFA